MLKGFQKIILSLFILSMLACNQNAVYEFYNPIPDAMWYYEKPLSFDFEIEDTEANYDIILMVRHTTEYPNMNFWVDIETVFPDGNSKKQKVDLPLADQEGKWFGHGLGKIKTNEIVIQQGAKMPSTGKYVFKIHQDMRYEPVTEISDLGLRIEKSE